MHRKNSRKYTFFFNDKSVMEISEAALGFPLQVSVQHFISLSQG